MPANLTPAYKSAEAAYKRARDPKERLELLRDMLRLIPKHKGTDHLQADIKSKMKELTEALSGPKKGGARGGPPTSFRPEGAGQVVLIGPPNTGKSTLHVQLTGSHSETGPYPFTTQFPQPGMMPHLDIAFQLLDLPPISAQHPIPWIGNTLQAADGCLLVVDLGHPECIEETLAVHEILRERKVELTERWPSDGGTIGDPDDPFTLFLPTILVATKADRNGSALQEPLPSGLMGITPRVFALGKMPRATNAPSKSGTSGTSKTSTIPARLAQERSKWPCGDCG